MTLLTFPNHHQMALSIRATALVFEDPKSNDLLHRIHLVAPRDCKSIRSPSSTSETSVAA